jgi:large subunit ribosomal protein L18
MADMVGEEIAKKALAKKIKTVTFDRNGFRFHGRVKAVADGARKGGLVF